MSACFTFDELLNSNPPVFNDLPIYSNVYSNYNKDTLFTRKQKKHGTIAKLSPLQGAYIAPIT